MTCVSCEGDQDGECFQSAGETVETRIELDDFNFLEIHDLFDVYLVDDTLNELIISAGSNLHDDIELKTKGNKLHVYNNAKCRWLRDYQRVVLTFRMKDLKFIRFRYPCYLASRDTLRWPDLDVYCYAKVFEADLKVNNHSFTYGVNFTCAGSCFLSGKTDKLTIMNRGVHHIFADSTVSVHANITNNSNGDIHAGRTDTLEAHIWRSGNIYYFGQPEIVTRDITSTGKLIRKGE